jgi:mannose/fructose/N-acetylgalactosamine-specific phosphotransferase system component IID
MVLNSLSELILSITAFAVFLIYFQRRPIYGRLVWGIFFITLSITSLLAVLWYLGWDELAPVVESMRRLSATLGPLCMMVGTWLLISHSVATRFTFWATLGTGAGLFLGLSMYRLSPLIQVVQPLCIVISLIIACWGLLQKQKSALWVVFAMTILALSSKLRLELNPAAAFGSYHILVAASMICLGKAIEAEYRILFK